MQFIKIKVNDCEQWFYKMQPSPVPRRYLDATKKTVIKDYIPSLVIAMPEEKAILKLIRARKWVEYVKLLWNRSRASKEITGNNLLKKIGVHVPAIFESGLGLFPAKGYQFLGYYIMQDLQCQGFENSRFLFLENRIKPEQRRAFLDNVLKDVRKMRDNHIVFNDFKLENIFCNDAGDTVWIDTGVTYYPAYRQMKFIKKHNDAIDYFLLHHEKFLTTDETGDVKKLYV